MKIVPVGATNMKTHVHTKDATTTQQCESMEDVLSFDHKFIIDAINDALVRNARYAYYDKTRER